MRKKLTDAEKTLWRELCLRQMGGYKFRRQQPLGRYIVDFICFEKKLIIELDGGQHSDPKQLAYDSQRTAWLESEGFRVLRFWDNQVLNENELESVKEVIWEVLRF